MINFQNNQTYKINADVYPDIPLSGKVIMIGSKANIGNSFPVQFQVANTQNSDIKSGMFGKVSFSENIQEKGILIPSSAVINEIGIAKVYLIKSGKAVLQPIITSRNIGNKTVVSSGLNENDVIVINGFINLFDGANISTK